MVQQDRPERKDRGGTQDEAGGREASIQVLHLLHERTVEDGLAANRPRQRLAAVGWYGHGEFVCDKIWELAPICRAPDDVEEMACMDRDRIVRYLNKCHGWAWHISDLKIYDQPRPLSNFTRLRATKFGYEPVDIKRPPQSWFYVEDGR